jgi:uncharacterized protein (TIGR02246 family)
MSPTELLSAYLAAANRHDLEAVLALVDDNAVYFFSDGSSHVGKAAIRSAIERNFASIRNEIYRLENLRWLVETAEVAVCIYEFHWTGEVDGERVEGGRRGTSVLQRKSGEWRVALEHLSSGAITP